MGQEKEFSFPTLLFILILGILLKFLLVFFLPIYHDLGAFSAYAHYHDSAYMNLLVLQHPPLGYYPYLLSLKILGIHDYALRIVPFLFSILEIPLLYFISRRWFGKTTAFYSLLLFSLTYFATFHSLSPEGDGSIMGLFSLLLLFSFLEWYATSEQKYLLVSGIFLGILFLIKVRAVLFLLPLFFYSYYKTRDVWKTIKHMISISFYAGAIFSIFPLLVYLANPEFFLPLMERVITHNVSSSSYFYKITHPSLFVPIFILLSALYLFLSFQGVWSTGESSQTGLKRNSTSNKEKDACMLLLLWFVSLFIILLAIIPEGLAGVYPRYISFLASPLILLSARGFTSLKLSPRMITWILFYSILFSLFLLYLNQLAPVPKGYWYFMSAVLGILKISKAILFSVFGLSGVLLVLFYFSKQKKFWISLFLVINIGFQLLLIADPFVDQTHRKIITDFTTYYEQHNIKRPIFTWADDLGFYLGEPASNINLMTESWLYAYAEKIGYNDKGYYYIIPTYKESMGALEKEGGTVFSLYYPLKYTLDADINRKNEYEYLLNHCTLLAEFNYPHAKGVIFEC